MMNRDPEDAFRIGYLYFTKGNLRQAENWWESVAACHDGAAFNLARLYLDTGRLSQAAAMYRKLTQRQPSRAAAGLQSVGLAHLRQNNVDPAVRDLADAADMGNADAAFNLGLLYLDIGLLEAAVHQWRVATLLGSIEAAENLDALGRNGRN